MPVLLAARICITTNSPIRNFTPVDSKPFTYHKMPELLSESRILFSRLFHTHLLSFRANPYHPQLRAWYERLVSSTRIFLTSLFFVDKLSLSYPLYAVGKRTRRQQHRCRPFRGAVWRVKVLPSVRVRLLQASVRNLGSRGISGNQGRGRGRMHFSDHCKLRIHNKLKASLGPTWTLPSLRPLQHLVVAVHIAVNYSPRLSCDIHRRIVSRDRNG